MDSLPLSALQHWLFCPRQSALIHVERLWEGNRLTAEGRLLHERADEGRPESRDGIRVLRAVQVASVRMKVHGVADIVELHGKRPYPVEYKRGRPKVHRADEVQLCAQGICLEEMTGQGIPEGALFYGARRRRSVVSFDNELRALTARTAEKAFHALSAGILPAPVYEPGRCEACSLKQLCQPLAPRGRARDWLERQVDRGAVPE